MTVIAKAELSYTAGIVDGEGCITIGKVKRQKMKRGCYFYLDVRVVNTNEWLLQWLRFSYGGTIYKQTGKRNANWKDSWVWIIGDRHALAFLELILPYLKIKRPQAELAMQFQKARRRGCKKSDEEHAVEEARAVLMHKYNRRGKLEVT